MFAVCAFYNHLGDLLHIHNEARFFLNPPTPSLLPLFPFSPFSFLLLLLIFVNIYGTQCSHSLRWLGPGMRRFRYFYLSHTFLPWFLIQILSQNHSIIRKAWNGTGLFCLVLFSVCVAAAAATAAIVVAFQVVVGKLYLTFRGWLISSVLCKKELQSCCID